MKVIVPGPNGYVYSPRLSHNKYSIRIFDKNDKPFETTLYLNAENNDVNAILMYITTHGKLKNSP